MSLGPGLSTQSCTHSLPVAVWRAVWYNCVSPGTAWMRDEWSVSRGLCAGVSTVNPRKGPTGGEVTSLTTDPNRTLNPVTRHPPSSNSVTANWGSLGWRVFIQIDVLQLCLDWSGLLLQETLEGEVFQMFQAIPCSTWMPVVLYQGSPKVSPFNLELATPGLPSTGSPPWAVPAALIFMCGEGGLEGKVSLWAGAG